MLSNRRSLRIAKQRAPDLQRDLSGATFKPPSQRETAIELAADQLLQRCVGRLHRSSEDLRGEEQPSSIDPKFTLVAEPLPVLRVVRGTRVFEVRPAGDDRRSSAATDLGHGHDHVVLCDVASELLRSVELELHTDEALVFDERHSLHVRCERRVAHPAIDRVSDVFGQLREIGEWMPVLQRVRPEEMQADRGIVARRRSPSSSSSSSV